MHERAENENSMGERLVMVDDIHAKSTERIRKGLAVTQVSHHNFQRILSDRVALRQQNLPEFLRAVGEELTNEQGKENQKGGGHNPQSGRTGCFYILRWNGRAIFNAVGHLITSVHPMMDKQENTAL